jgi:hypothetical protein
LYGVVSQPSMIGPSTTPLTTITLGYYRQNAISLHNLTKFVKFHIQVRIFFPVRLLQFRDDKEKIKYPR